MTQRTRDESGAVTAEAALGIGLLAVIAVGLAWMICLGVVAVQAQDAAREAVRALARGESTTHAVDLAQQVAPRGSRVSTESDGDLVRVTVAAPVRGPGGFFAFIGNVTLTGRAVGAIEDAGPAGG